MKYLLSLHKPLHLKHCRSGPSGLKWIDQSGPNEPKWTKMNRIDQNDPLMWLNKSKATMDIVLQLLDNI